MKTVSVAEVVWFLWSGSFRKWSIILELNRHDRMSWQKEVLFRGKRRKSFYCVSIGRCAFSFVPALLRLAVVLGQISLAGFPPILRDGVGIQGVVHPLGIPVPGGASRGVERLVLHTLLRPFLIGVVNISLHINAFNTVAHHLTDSIKNIGELTLEHEDHTVVTEVAPRAV